MLDYEEQRKAIIVFVLGVILVVILTIVMLVFIWIPEDEETEPAYEIGKINSTSVQESDVVSKYYNELYLLFLNNDIDNIFKLIGNDYIEFNELDIEKTKTFLLEKGVLSKNLELVQYESYWIPGYNNVYSLDLKAKNEAYSINVVIRETSPEKYTIAFEKFIDYKNDVYNATVDSIEMDIYQRIRYTNSVEYRFKLTNNYDKEVKINSGATATPIILVDTQQNSRRPILTSLSTAEITLNPKDSRIFTAVFDIKDTYDYISYNMLVLKNIEFSGITGTTNLEYTM